MALSVSEANAVTKQGIENVLIETAYDSHPFFYKLKKERLVTQKGGTDIRWQIRYDKLGKANAVDPDAQRIRSKKPTRTQAVEDWKYYLVDAFVSWKERQQNEGKFQTVKLVGDKYKEMKEDFQDRLGTDLYTANPNGRGITPLSTIVHSTGTYAGISPTDAANWAATLDSSTTRLEFYGGTTSLDAMINSATWGKQMPTMGLTTKTIYGYIRGYMTGKMIAMSNKEMVDAGFKNVQFEGMTIMPDVNCTANYFYGLNLKQFELRVDPKYNMKTTEWKELEHEGYVNSIGKDMSWTGNLICKHRKSNFLFSALSDVT